MSVSVCAFSICVYSREYVSVFSSTSVREYAGVGVCHFSSPGFLIPQREIEKDSQCVCAYVCVDVFGFMCVCVCLHLCACICKSQCLRLSACACV